MGINRGLKQRSIAHWNYILICQDKIPLLKQTELDRNQLPAYNGNTFFPLILIRLALFVTSPFALLPLTLMTWKETSEFRGLGKWVVGKVSLLEHLVPCLLLSLHPLHSVPSAHVLPLCF